jgi:hypothetical protein
MPAAITIAVVAGFGGFSATLAIAGVMLCVSAQRQGREVALDWKFAFFRFRYHCVQLTTAATPLRAVPDAEDETAGQHHTPSTSEASDASRDTRPIRLGSRRT